MDPNLYMAVTDGNAALVSRHIKEAKTDLRKQPSPHNKNTLLHIAANSNNVEVVKVIREHRPILLISKNYRDETALHIAARHGNATVVEYLLGWTKETAEAEKWPDSHYMVKSQNRDGNTALHEAVLGRHRGVVEVLMQSDQEAMFIQNKNKESPLYLAADRGLFQVVEKMLKVTLQDQDLKKKKELHIYGGPNGRTPLHAAIARRHTLIIQILLETKKELISRADGDGRTPLHYAASFGYSEEVRCLLQKDASIAHQKDKQGIYPIHIAANKGCLDIMQDILKYCLEARETLNQEDQNVVHLAAKSGRAKLISYMLQASKLAKLINAKDRKGNTPLHLATMNSHPKVVNILIRDRRVDMTIMNDEGLTALDIAEKHMADHETISLPKALTVTALRTAGAPPGRPSPTIEENTSKDDRKTEYYREKFKERFSTLVLVATLISTVTFAAGFTVPGGYNGDGPNKGMATLLRKTAFQVFVICNTMALYLSIFVVVNHIWAQLGDIRLLILAVNLSSPLLGIALIMMAVAFAADLASVLPHRSKNLPGINRAKGKLRSAPASPPESTSTSPQVRTSVEGEEVPKFIYQQYQVPLGSSGSLLFNIESDTELSVLTPICSSARPFHKAINNHHEAFSFICGPPSSTQSHSATTTRVELL